MLEDAVGLLGNAVFRLNSWRQRRFSEYQKYLGKRTLKSDLPADKHLFPDIRLPFRSSFNKQKRTWENKGQNAKDSSTFQNSNRAGNR